MVAIWYFVQCQLDLLWESLEGLVEPYCRSARDYLGGLHSHCPFLGTMPSCRPHQSCTSSLCSSEPFESDCATLRDLDSWLRALSNHSKPVSSAPWFRHIRCSICQTLHSIKAQAYLVRRLGYSPLESTLWSSNVSRAASVHNQSPTQPTQHGKSPQSL